MILQGFAEAIVGIQVQGTMMIPDEGDPSKLNFLKLDYTGRRSWPYIKFHFSEADHAYLSLN